MQLDVLSFWYTGKTATKMESNPKDNGTKLKGVRNQQYDMSVGQWYQLYGVEELFPRIDATINNREEELKMLPTYRMVPVEQFYVDPVHEVSDATHCM